MPTYTQVTLTVEDPDGDSTKLDTDFLADCLNKFLLEHGFKGVVEVAHLTEEELLQGIEEEEFDEDDLRV